MGFQKITHSVDLYRLVRSGNNEQYGATPVYQKLEVGIFPASPDIMATYPGEGAFQLYEVFLYDAVTLKNGDKLAYSGEEWIVRGVPQVFDSNLMSYTRLICEKVI